MQLKSVIIPENFRSDQNDTNKHFMWSTEAHSYLIGGKLFLASYFQLIVRIILEYL